MAGSIPGIFLLKHTDAGLLKVIFGIAVIVIGIEMLFREMKSSKSSNKTSGGSKIVLVLIGIISGLLCGLYGVGALLAAHVSRVAENSHEFKANICVVFVVENTIRIILYAATGILTLAVLKQVVILIPFMLAAVFLGMKSSSVLNEKVIKKIVIVLLILSGIVLIINNIPR